MARPLTRLSFADYAPDAAPYLSGSVPVARNTVPRVDGTDGPLRGPVVIAGPLPAPCRGAFAARDRFGATYLVAGTQTGLFVLAGSGWENISREGGYNTQNDGSWQFAQFGERVIATNDADPPQSWLLGSAGFGDIAGAPRARSLAAVEPGFIMLGRYDTGSGTLAAGLSWSGINDATLWPEPGTLAATSVQRDIQELPNGGAVVGIVPAVGGANAVILSERAIHRVEYAGPPAIFAFREVDRSRGCICPNGIAVVGGAVYFVSEDGFLAYDGNALAPIGQGKVDATFLRRVDQSQLHRVLATVDPDRKLIVWAYPTAGADAPREWLVYSYATGKWRTGDDASLAVEALLAARQAALTLDDEGTTTGIYVEPGYVEADYVIHLDVNGDANLDAPGLPSFDASAYAGGRRLFAGFDPLHRLVTFDGVPLPARLETQDTDSQDGRRVFVSGVRLLTDAPTYSAAVGMRERLADGVTYGSPTPAATDGMCPQRVSGRYGRAAVAIPGGVEWSYLQGLEVVMRPEGRR